MPHQPRSSVCSRGQFCASATIALSAMRPARSRKSARMSGQCSAIARIDTPDTLEHSLRGGGEARRGVRARETSARPAASAWAGAGRAVT